MSNQDHIDGHLSAKQMQDYLAGKLSGLESNKIERHLLACSFCAEAMDGLENSGNHESFLHDVDELKQKIKASVGEKKVISLWNTPAKIAAAILVIAISTLVIILNLNPLQESQPTEKALGLAEPEEEVSPEAEVAEELQVIAENKDKQPKLKAEKPKQMTTQPNLAEQKNATTQTALADEEVTDIETDEAIAGEGFAAIEELAEKEVALDLAMEDIESLSSDTLNPTDIIAAEPLRKEVITAPAPLALNALAVEKIDKAEADVEVLEESRAKTSRRSAKKNQVAAAFEAEEELTIDPTPETGYDDYAKYLRENLRYPLEAKRNNVTGIVVVTLTVQENGSLADFEIKQGLGFGCDEEAIRLIKEGPTWVSGTVNNINTPQSVEVEVRFEFDK